MLDNERLRVRALSALRTASVDAYTRVHMSGDHPNPRHNFASKVVL
jgi:hypothetical protein